MKKFLITIIILFTVVNMFSSDNVYFNEEYRKSFDFFWEQANTEKDTPGYGLVRDRYPSDPNIASIASTGFALSALPIGVENGWITYSQGYERALGTLETITGLENIRGFYYHFLNISDGKRINKSEISTIDTAILICGVLTAGEYFGGEIKEKAVKIYSDVNWKIFTDKLSNNFYMSLTPEKGFSGRWDFYGEQLMMYILGAGSPTYPTGDKLYYSFKRNIRAYKGNEFIHSWFGSLFTYQYSHAWIDFRNKKDKLDVNWFQNSVYASLANYQYCQDLEYKSFSSQSWGLSACDSPSGYNGFFGALPAGYDDKTNFTDGTVAVSAALGSVVFTPDKSLTALNYFYTIDGLSGRYGLKNAFNSDKNWIAKDYIGIDKGITLLMFANYKNNLIWNIVSKISYINRGMEILQIK